MNLVAEMARLPAPVLQELETTVSLANPGQTLASILKLLPPRLRGVLKPEYFYPSSGDAFVGGYRIDGPTELRELIFALGLLDAAAKPAGAKPILLGLAELRLTTRSRDLDEADLKAQMVTYAKRLLLVGSDNETTAEQLTTQTTPARAADVNRLGPSLAVATDSNIDDYRWYLFADPAVAPTMVYGSLPGQTGPIVTMQPGWDVAGLEIKVIRDFAVGPVDYKGGYFNSGAAPAP